MQHLSFPHFPTTMFHFQFNLNQAEQKAFNESWKWLDETLRQNTQSLSLLVLQDVGIKQILKVLCGWDDAENVDACLLPGKVSAPWRKESWIVLLVLKYYPGPDALHICWFRKTWNWIVVSAKLWSQSNHSGPSYWFRSEMTGQSTPSSKASFTTRPLAV